MNIMTFLAAAAEGSGDAASTGGLGALLTMILPLGLMVLIFYFLIIRPEKKRTKETENMLNNIQVADEVITNGGIIGRVLSVQKDTVMIETGSDRTKIRVVKSAIAQNKTQHEAMEQAAAEVKTNKKGKKEIK